MSFRLPVSHQSFRVVNCFLKLLVHRPFLCDSAWKQVKKSFISTFMEDASCLQYQSHHCCQLKKSFMSTLVHIINYIQCSLEPLHASTHTGKQFVLVSKHVKSQKLHICWCILCFDLEAKTLCQCNSK
jgi:hypothetical protein